MTFSGDCYKKREMKLATKLLGEKPIYLWMKYDINDSGVPTLEITCNVSRGNGYANKRLVKHYTYIDNNWLEM